MLKKKPLLIKLFIREVCIPNTRRKTYLIGIAVIFEQFLAGHVSVIQLCDGCIGAKTAAAEPPAGSPRGCCVAMLQGPRVRLGRHTL